MAFLWHGFGWGEVLLLRCGYLLPVSLPPCWYCFSSDLFCARFYNSVLPPLRSWLRLLLDFATTRRASSYFLRLWLILCSRLLTLCPQVSVCCCFHRGLY
jgi:hypothetical protein